MKRKKVPITQMIFATIPRPKWLPVCRYII